MNRRIVFSLAAVLALGACTDEQKPSPTEVLETPSLASAKKSRSYVIRLSETAPADVQARIERAGGRLKNISREAGVASFESDAADFATKVRALPGVEGAGLDRTIQWIDPNQRFIVAEDHHGGGTPVGTTERWFPIQWNMQAISAPKAWKKGELGKGARVAILDGGIWDQHVDIAPNLDVARSRSFATGAFNTDLGTFWHGTHVAGIVAAADNADNLGTIGVAPRATLIGVKVLHGGTGSFQSVIDGIIYAATPIRKGGAGADIINMSLGATFVPEPGDEELLEALDKATTFARKQGVLVIASAGNGDDLGIGIDHDANPDLVTIPAQSKYVVGVSALGPVGFALGATNFDRLSSYSNFGKSIVNLSGPGGDFMLPDQVPPNCTLAINANPPVSTTTTVTQPCWVFDMVVSSCRGTGVANVCWAAGTSMSSPAVAGVAALIVGKKGRMSPDRLLDALEDSSDDLGRRGFDAVYGKGRVNAARAVGAGGRGDDDDDDDDRRGRDDGLHATR